MLKLVYSLLVRRVQSLRIKRAHSLVGVARDLRGSGQQHLALRKLRHAVALDPTNVLALSLLGRALAEERQYDSATECFEDALALHPDHAGAFTDLGTVYRLKGDLGRAEIAYRRALELDNSRFLGALRSCTAPASSGCVGACSGSILRVAHRGLPFHGEILKSFVETLIARRELEEAEYVCVAAAHTNPGLYEAWLTSGIVCQQLHRPAEALAHYGRAAALCREEDPELLNARAIAMQDLEG